MICFKRLTEELKEAIDYWKEYKGETVRIEKTRVKLHNRGPQETIKITHWVEGTVSKVMTLPPGFLWLC
jgi:hypothetical protein